VSVWVGRVKWVEGNEPSHVRNLGMYLVVKISILGDTGNPPRRTPANVGLIVIIKELLQQDPLHYGRGGEKLFERCTEDDNTLPVLTHVLPTITSPAFSKPRKGGPTVGPLTTNHTSPLWLLTTKISLMQPQRFQYFYASIQ
jgi:hypothetical protein